MAKKRLFLDWAYGRAGTFLEVVRSDVPGYVTIKWRPLGFLSKVQYIPDVPEAAIYYAMPHPLTPSEGVVIAIAGTNGKSPLFGEQMGGINTHLLKEVTRQKTLREQSEAKTEIEQKRRLRQEDEVTHEALKQAKDISKAQWPYGMDYKKPRDRTTLAGD